MSLQTQSAEKVAEQTMRRWLVSQHVEERLRADNVEENVGPYITLSRETGAGGSEIARLVGRKLGWDVLDRDLLDLLAEKYHEPRTYIGFVDEKKASWISDIFTTWIERQPFTQTTFVHQLSHLFLLAAHHGKVVIVGRGAQYVLPRDKGLSVRILAPLDFRIEQVLLQRGVSAKEARAS